MDKIKKLMDVMNMQVIYLQMSEFTPFITKLLPVSNFMEKAEKHFKTSYTEEEVDFLLNMYSSPIGVSIIKKMGQANISFQEDIRRETMEKLEGMSEEEREELLEDIAMYGG